MAKQPRRAEPALHIGEHRYVPTAYSSTRKTNTLAFVRINRIMDMSK